jgi:WD40 repeat protein/tRNA A-37 threonylcarbamoyl transferase component Bud32
MNPAPEDSARSRRLEAALHDYLQAVDAGRPPDREALVRQHPDLASELAAFFANQDEVARIARDMAGPVGPAARASEAPTLAPGEAAAPAPGTRLRYFGDYELLEEVARGGMGVVFKARQVSLNRTVALKMILAGELASPTEVQRFRTEAEAAAHLQHPHIVAIFEVGEHQGQHFFSMEYIDGPSLARLVRENPLPPARAAGHVATIARAIHHAHQKGILHRDLKPANVLLDPTDTPHVTDFGLAKRVEGKAGLTATGAILGTPSYMAPEQASAGRGAVGPLSDVYSLGAILFELLTGRPPFQAETPLDTVLQVVGNEVVAPRLLNPALPRDLETVCLKCLQKDPHKRYPSAEALADDLDRWRRGEPIRARPVGAVERSWRWCRRNPAIAGLVAAALACLLAGTAVSTFYAVEAQDRAELAEKNADRADRETERTRAALDRLRHVSFAQSIALVRGELEANNVERALALLDACPAELRHWEWRYLSRLCRGELRTLDCQALNLRALAYRPDGQVLAGGGGMVGFGPFLGNQELVLWSNASGLPQKPFRAGAPEGAITGVAWSPGGDRLALSLWCLDDARDVLSGADEARAGRVEIWDVRQGKLVHAILGHHSFVNGVAWSADGSKVASAGSDRTAQVWEAGTGKRLHRLEGHRGQVMSVAFSPKGDLLATGGQGHLTRSSSQTPDDRGEVKLWDLASGREKFALEGHPLGVLAVAFSPDGTVLASASRDRTVRLWDTRTGKLLRTLFGHTDDVTAVAFAPRGGLLATAGADRGVRLWDWADGKPLAVLRGHRLPVRALAFHSDGRHLASCAFDHGRGAEVKTWDVAAPREVTVCPAVANAVMGLEVSPDGRRVAALLQLQGLERSSWRVFDAATGKALFAANGDGQMDALRFSADGTRLITLRGNDRVTVQVLDAASGRKVSSFDVRQFEAKARPFYFSVAPALAPHGDWFAAADVARKAVVLRNCADGKEVRRFAFPVTADETQLLFSPDRRRLAAVCQRRFHEKQPQWWTVNVTAWDTETGRALLSEEPKDFQGQGYRAQWSPDGTTLAVPGEGHRVRLWQPDRQASFDLDVEGDCLGLRFSPDGGRLATVHWDRNRPLMHVWEVASRRKLFTLGEFAEGHPSVNAAEDVVFSADGRRLFTGGDGTVKVWDATQGHLLLTQRPAFSPVRLTDDGTTLVAGGPQGATLIWFAPPP